jgi:hypothetical protein
MSRYKEHRGPKRRGYDDGGYKFTVGHSSATVLQY